MDKLILIIMATLFRRMHGGFAFGSTRAVVHRIASPIGAVGYSGIIAASLGVGWLAGLAVFIGLVATLKLGHGALIGSFLRQAPDDGDPEEIERLFILLGEHPRSVRMSYVRSLAALSCVRALPVLACIPWSFAAVIVGVTMLLAPLAALHAVRDGVGKTFTVQRQWESWEAIEGAVVGVALAIAGGL